MKISVPTQVDLNGFKIPIRYKDRLENGHMGEFSGGKIAISKMDHKTGEELLATLFHEILHAVLWKSGITALVDAIEGVDVEEAIVASLEHHLSESIKIKPKCLKKLKTIEIGIE